MKVLSITLLIIFISIAFTACEESELPEQENFKIEFGSECGWCAGQEFITVTNSEIKYLRNIPCGDEKGTTKSERNITSSEWNELTVSFNYSLFKTSNYNTCNVCADGCDEIIRITENDSIHELRYSPTENVEGMQDLRQILNEFMEEMRDKN